MAWRILTLALPLLAQADKFCNLMRNPGCSPPFLPGHKDMGDSWVALGKKGNTIMSLATTLNVSAPSASFQGVMAINSAMENTDVTDTMDTHPVRSTHQTITATFPQDWEGCGQSRDQWCTFPSLYLDTLQPPQVFGEVVRRDPGPVKLTWTYARATPSDPMKVFMTAGGQTGLALPVADPEPPWQWWPKTECQCESKGAIPAHQYLNTKVKLQTADPSWGNSITKASADFTPPTTNDGGKTWKIEEIFMYQTWCQNDKPCSADETKSPTSTNWRVAGPNPTNPTGPPIRANARKAQAQAQPTP